MRVQLGVRLTRSAPLPVEELLHIEHRVAFEHIIDGPRQFMRQDGPSFPLVMLLRQSGQRLLACLIVAQQQRRSFGKGPGARSMPYCFARSPQAFATRCLRTCDQATVRGKVLHAGATGDLVACVAQHEAADRAKAGHGLPQVQGMRGMVFGRLDAREFYVSQ